MTEQPFRIRNYTPGDFDRIVNLESHEETPQHGCFRTLSFDVAESLGFPHRFPEKNLFVAEAGGEIVGYAYVMPELDIGRVVLSCFVHPSHDSKDLAANLVARALRRAEELEVVSVQVNVHEKNATTIKFFSEMGFDRIRRFLEMSLDVSALPFPDMREILSVCTHLEPGEEGTLTFIQNRSFIDTWGFNPSTKEEIVYRMQLSRCSPNVILLCEKGQPIGYCWTRIESNKHERDPRGHIHMLGVDPNHRGKGIGKQVLLAGLSHLQKEGIRLVELTVDEENTAACELYASLGFEISGRTVWYEDVLD